MKNIPLFLTEPHPCSYLDGKLARSLFVHPDYKMTADLYGRLIAQGFRRSGDDVYRPHCQPCAACVPARISVADFKPDRSQKRCWGKNSAMQVLVKPAVFEQAHYEMYLRYQAVRHGDGDMAHSSPDDYLGFLSSSWCNTQFIEFSIGNRLAGIAVVDFLSNAWSAVYTFFEPEFSSYSLGVYAVLWQIEALKRQQQEFLYLGFWIKDCQKMAYKSNYRPLQVLLDDQWIKMPG
jgi:arginine-tRNA-protein transferase